MSSLLFDNCCNTTLNRGFKVCFCELCNVNYIIYNSLEIIFGKKKGNNGFNGYFRYLAFDKYINITLIGNNLCNTRKTSEKGCLSQNTSHNYIILTSEGGFNSPSGCNTDQLNGDVGLFEFLILYNYINLCLKGMDGVRYYNKRIFEGGLKW